MSLTLFLRTVPAVVRRHEAAFQAARATEPALAPYAPAGALLDALAPTSALSMRDRQPLMQAVLARHKAVPHALWQALLVASLEPVLRRLGKYGRGTKEEREQRVLLAFLEALRVVRPTGPIFLSLRRATTRALFDALRAEGGSGELVPPDEQLDAGDAPPHADAPPFVACLAREVAAQLLRRPDGEDVARIVTGVETAAEQAARLTAAPSPGRTARVTVAGVRQRRHRVMRDLRAKLGERR